MRGKFLLFVLSVVLIHCNKKEQFTQTKIIGHAGMGLGQANSVFVDNSKESIQMALDQTGCSGVEVDLQMAADGSTWLFHDFELDQRTNLQGCIPDKTSLEMKNGEYKTWKKEKIASTDILQQLSTQNQTLILDLKPVNTCKNTYLDPSSWKEEIKKLQESINFNEVICISTYYNWINQINDTSISLYYELSDPNEILSHWSQYEFIDGFVFRNRDISKDQIIQLHQLGKKVIIFDVRSPKKIREALRKNPDYLITDDLRATLIEIAK